MYNCNCGWKEEDEWYKPYPAHDDTCLIQIKLIKEINE